MTDFDRIIDRVADAIAERVAERMRVDIVKACTRAPDTDNRLNTPDAARYLGVASKTLEIWRIKGGGPAFVKMGARVSYRQSDLDQYIAERVCTSTAGKVKS